MGKVSQNVPYFYHFPPIFLPYVSILFFILEHFHTYSIVHSPFPPIFLHCIPFSFHCSSFVWKSFCFGKRMIKKGTKEKPESEEVRVQGTHVQ